MSLHVSLQEFAHSAGLKAISEMTATPRLMRVEVTRWSGAVYVAEYSGFTVGDASTLYTMNYASFININMSGDSLSPVKGLKFSTFDKDDLSSISCAAKPDSGVWMGAGNIWHTLQHIRLLLQV